MAVDIPVKRLARHCNPFGGTWGGEKPVRRADVRRALRERRAVSTPYEQMLSAKDYDHAGRIAYLIENVTDDPIDIDVGIPVLNFYVEWYVTDGNHRLAAAIFAERPTIKACVAGQMDYAKRLFGVNCESSD